MVATLLSFVLNSCFTDVYTEPYIEFRSSSGFKFPADSIAAGKSINVELRCVNNGSDLLTRLYIYKVNNNDIIEDMAIRPPISSFGYKLSLTKTKSDTDTVMFELHDEDGNITQSMVFMHKK